MSTVISPEILETNPWWIPRQRYYELKHFCLQYPEWKRALEYLDGHQYQAELTDIPKTKTNITIDVTSDVAIVRESLSKRIDMIELAAEKAGADLSSYILKSITEGIPYSILRSRNAIPCCRNEYYDKYRKFFWILDKLRD